MRKMIHIEKPYIESAEGMIRLCANTVWSKGDEREIILLYFEAKEEWGKYFVTEFSDAFVLAVLENALNDGMDISFEQPVSEDLYYQLERFLIPIFARNIEECEKIQLIGSSSSQKLESKNVVGTGFSAGVDSYHTILSNLNTKFERHNVTHLLLCVNGAAFTGISTEISQSWYSDIMKRNEPLANELHMKLIGINSNIDLLIQKRRILKGGDIVFSSSFVHALRKLFGTYYWASSYTADVLKFSITDGGYMEPLTIPLVSVSGLKIYHAGSEVNRLEKVKMIADNEAAQHGLLVCGELANCGRCVKCIRTMAELYSINKLDKFKSVFPVEDYKRHLWFRFAEELTADHPPFTTEILNEMKKNHKKIPFKVYLLKSIYFKPIYYLRKKLKNKSWAMKLYYQHHFDKKIMGITHDDEYVRARMEGRGK